MYSMLIIIISFQERFICQIFHVFARRSFFINLQTSVNASTKKTTKRQLLIDNLSQTPQVRNAFLFIVFMKRIIMLNFFSFSSTGIFLSEGRQVSYFVRSSIICFFEGEESMDTEQVRTGTSTAAILRFQTANPRFTIIIRYEVSPFFYA